MMITPAVRRCETGDGRVNWNSAMNTQVTPPMVSRNEPRFGSSPVRNSIPDRNPDWLDSAGSEEDSGGLMSLLRLRAGCGVAGVDCAAEHLYEMGHPESGREPEQGADGGEPKRVVERGEGSEDTQSAEDDHQDVLDACIAVRTTYLSKHLDSRYRVERIKSDVRASHPCER